MTKDKEHCSTSGIIEVERLGETVVLTPTQDLGELHSEAIAEGLQAVRSELKDTDFQNVVLDFHRTDYFGSTVIGEFVHLWKDVDSRDGQMAFCGLSPHEREILKISRLDDRWLICESRDEAISKLRETEDKNQSHESG